jgi:hypothetical protein
VTGQFTACCDQNSTASSLWVGYPGRGAEQRGRKFCCGALQNARAISDKRTHPNHGQAPTKAETQDSLPCGVVSSLNRYDSFSNKQTELLRL